MSKSTKAFAVGVVVGVVAYHLYVSAGAATDPR